MYILKTIKILLNGFLLKFLINLFIIRKKKVCEKGFLEPNGILGVSKNPFFFLGGGVRKRVINVIFEFDSLIPAPLSEVYISVWCNF